MRLITCILGLLMLFPLMGADRTDTGGYPIMYLRGTNIGNGWDCNDAHRFSRQGDVYTLHIDWLDGHFKVSGSDWVCNYGGTEQNVTIDRSSTVQAVQDGKNFVASALANVTITFTLKLDGKRAAPTDITFATNSGTSTTNGQSNTLPVIYVNVYKTDSEGNIQHGTDGKPVFDNEIISKDLAHKNYFTAEYWLDINGCQWAEEAGLVPIGTPDKPLATEIKARGNYTRTAYAKKPYKLKLGKSQNLLGLTPDKSKHYALLAHADDNRGYLRNFIGFNLGKRIGLPWTPSQVPVELVINGDYRGLYFLTESIRVGDGRIEISKLSDNETESYLISGGYVVELDNYQDVNQIEMAEKSCVNGHQLDRLRITFDTPEEYSQIQRRFINEQFSKMNEAVGSNSDDLWSYLDLDDAVRYYIVREVTSDTEAFHGSTYLYRDRGEGMKWHFSPIWDCGQAFNGHTDDYFYNCDPYGNTWIPSLRQNRRFNDKLTETWLWFAASCYDGIIDDIDDYVNAIAIAAKADHKRWKDAPTPNGGRGVADNSDMNARRNAVVQHLQDKVRWLCRQWGTPTGSETEPERDDTPAALLPTYAGTDFITIDNPASSYIYNLMGIPVTAPLAPGFYIINGEKVLIK